MAFVQDVVHQQHAAAVQGGRRSVLPHQFAAGGLAAVTGGVQVVELQVQAARAQFQRQLAGERQRTVHDGQVDRHLTGVVACDGRGHLRDGTVDRRAIDQQVGVGQRIGQLRPRIAQRFHQATPFRLSITRDCVWP